MSSPSGSTIGSDLPAVLLHPGPALEVGLFLLGAANEVLLFIKGGGLLDLV